MNSQVQKLKSMEIAGFSSGAVVTAFGLLLWSPIVNNWNLIGFAITLFGLIGLGGFAKNKWY